MSLQLGSGSPLSPTGGIRSLRMTVPELALQAWMKLTSSTICPGFFRGSNERHSDTSV